MEHTEKIIQRLKSQGYDPVYIWEAKPNEEDSDHTHSFHTHLVVLDGALEIKMDDRSLILRPTDEIDFPKGKIHYGKASERGCKYIVAERH